MLYLDVEALGETRRVTLGPTAAARCRRLTMFTRNVSVFSVSVGVFSGSPVVRATRRLLLVIPRLNLLRPTKACVCTCVFMCVIKCAVVHNRRRKAPELSNVKSVVISASWRLLLHNRQLRCEFIALLWSCDLAETRGARTVRQQNKCVLII